MTPTWSLRAGARRDYGRLLARLLCALFALVGALPLLGGYLVRTKPVRRWAASETARVLREELGVAASYRVEMRIWPLEVSLHDVRIPSKDGGPPALSAKRMAVTPRVFSLLAGRLDVGDIEIDEPAVRLVIREGEVVNVAYKIPKRSGPSRKMTRAPFSSLAVSDASVTVDAEDVLATATAVDLDVFAENGPSFEVALRAGETTVTRRRSVEVEIHTKLISDLTSAPVTTTEVDDDVLCQLDVRLRAEADGDVLVRRLSLIGSADDDVSEATRPSCDLDPNDEHRVALRLSQLRVEPRDGGVPSVRGHVVARGPLAILNRFVRTLPLRGWVGVSADVRYDGETTLPDVRGKVRGEGIALGGYRLAKSLEATVRMADNAVRLPLVETGFADGTVVVRDALLDVLAEEPTLRAERVEAKGVTFPGLMRDLDVTEKTVIRWNHDRVVVSELHGTLSPLHLDGNLEAQTSGFEVFDRAYDDPARKHMIGVRAATLRGKIGVRPKSFEFFDTRASFGNSSLTTSVSLGYAEDLRLSIADSSTIDLRDITPLVDIEMAGTARLRAKMAGKFNHPRLEGEMRVAGFWFGGFPIGDITSSKVEFQPLKIDFEDVHGRKGKSEFVAKTARLDFDTRASLVADAVVESDDFDLRDFLAMWHFDEDPRFDPIFGSTRVRARVHYDMGGPKDACGGGLLRVAGTASMRNLELYEERYDSGRASFDFRWIDRDASYLGIELDVPSMTLSKGGGVALGSMKLRPGGAIQAHVAATGIPLSRIQALGSLGAAVEGRASALAEVYGTIDALRADAHVNVSPVRIGSKRLPASDFSVKLVPVERELRTAGKTRCGRPVPRDFDRKEFDADLRYGVFHASGQMFGGQARFDDLQVTRQRSKSVRGDVELSRLDLGAISEISPAVAAADSRLEGLLTGRIEIEELPLERPAEARAAATLSGLSVSRSGFRVALLPGSGKISLGEGRLRVPAMALSATTPGGQRGAFDVEAVVENLGAAPRVDASLVVRPTDLSAFTGLIPRAERASGTIRGRLAVRGPVGALRYTGNAELVDGELSIRGVPVPLSDIDLALAVDGDEVRIAHGRAKVGGGVVELTGSAPLLGVSVGGARAVITARNVSVPVAQGVKTTFDANLVATAKVNGGSDPENRSLPRIAGDVTVRSFEYTRPVTMAADISTLTRRGRRTRFEAYDPDDDAVEFDVTLRAPRPLEIRNNLIDAELVVAHNGISFAGTNQRFGMRGLLRIKPGGRIQFRRSEFEVRQGTVRFDDPTRIAPRVDVTAVTEYRRYSGTTGEATGGADTGGGTAAATGGRWNITMHAYGDAQKLRIDLASNPELAQDDIFLLLTLGLTRAELDQAQSASLGESVALEALGTLSGADRAVTKALPVIDEFRFGSAYSSRTGRTEPTVTIGKRLANRIRAHVTSGLAESREVRSNLEWRLNPKVSVEGSYDNVNDISSSSLGNLGADIRWRLDFD